MKPTLFIIEGPDCAGKTTLAKHLADFICKNKWMDAAYFRCYGKKVLFPAMSTIQTMVLDNAEHCVKNLGLNYVLDRHWPSEYVYGRVFRPETVAGFESDYFDKRIRDLGGIYVYCNTHDIRGRHAKNQDPAHPYDSISFDKVVKGYDEWFLTRIIAHNRHLNYDVNYHGKDMNVYCEELIEYANS